MQTTWAHNNKAINYVRSYVVRIRIVLFYLSPILQSSQNKRWPQSYSSLLEYARMGKKRIAAMELITSSL